MELNEIIINNIKYKVLDVREVAIADSFVLKNKLSGTTGHGEARLYLGSAKNNWYDFFKGPDFNTIGSIIPNSGACRSRSFNKLNPARKNIRCSIIKLYAKLTSNNSSLSSSSSS